MSIEIQEYVNADFKEVASKNFSTDFKESNDYLNLNPIDNNSIMQDIEGIHVGPTGNYTWYMEEALDSSIPSWTKPYQKPLIMHHNEVDGKTIGRVCSVTKETVNTRSGTPALVFTCNVPDEEGKKQILDGRLKTVSIGVIAHDVRCSICGKPIHLDEKGFNDACEHQRGEVYDNKVCYWQIYSMEAKELSYVIVPSDIYAHNIRTYKPKHKQISIEESLKNNDERNDFSMSKNNEQDIETKESTTIHEEIKDKDDTVQTPVQKEEENNNSELKAKIKELEAEKDKLQKDLDAANETIKTVKNDLTEITNKLNTEVKLKEGLENDLINVRKELRESTEEVFNCYRQSLNKSVVLKENLENRSLQSLKDSIVDLKEELSGLSAVKGISSSNDPTLKNEEKNKTVDVKESQTISNINFREELQNVLSRNY